MKAIGLHEDGNWRLTRAGPPFLVETNSVCVSATMQLTSSSQFHLTENNNNLVSNHILLKQSCSRKTGQRTGKVCSFLCYRNHQGECQSFRTPDVLTQASTLKVSRFQDLNKRQLDTAVLQNICEPSPVLLHKLKLCLQKIQCKCEDINMLSCLEDNSQCFQFSDICIFEVDIMGVVIPCRSGSHLQNCNTFQCNAHFKCPGHYCINWAHICNGKWDCPDGHDESEVHSCGTHRNCYLMFKCEKSGTCLHVIDVCDATKQCPFGDDESMCNIQDSQC